MTEKAAFCQLMGMPAPLALTAGSPRNGLQLEDKQALNKLVEATKQAFIEENPLKRSLNAANIHGDEEEF